MRGLDDEGRLEVKFRWLTGRPCGAQHHTTLTECCAIQCAAAASLSVACMHEISINQSCCVSCRHTYGVASFLLSTVAANPN